MFTVSVIKHLVIFLTVVEPWTVWDLVYLASHKNLDLPSNLLYKTKIFAMSVLIHLVQNAVYCCDIKPYIEVCMSCFVQNVNDISYSSAACVA